MTGKYKSIEELYKYLKNVVQQNIEPPNNTKCRYYLMQLVKQYPEIFNYNLEINAKWDNLNDCILDFEDKFGIAEGSLPQERWAEEIKRAAERTTPLPNNTKCRYYLMQLVKKYPGIFNYNLEINAKWDNLNDCMLDFEDKFEIAQGSLPPGEMVGGN